MPLGANKAAIMGVAGVSTADVVLLSSQTASSDASLTFTGLMTSTYGEYIFRFYNMNPESDNTHFTFQVNVVGASGYNETITSTFFYAQLSEGHSSAALAYDPAVDQAQGTAYQTIGYGIGSDADQSGVGELHIFNPSSTTYVTHFLSQFHTYHASDYANNHFVGGYINATGAVDDINFKFASGDFDGTIKMWGVK